MTKRCARCREVKDIGEYGVNRARKDGIAIYCRGCIKEKNLAYQRAMEMPARKGNVPAVPISKMRLCLREKVRIAYQRGLSYPDQIMIVVGAKSEDRLYDAIADLNDVGFIKWKPELKRFVAA